MADLVRTSASSGTAQSPSPLTPNNRKSALSGLVARPTSIFRRWKQTNQPSVQKQTPAAEAVARTFATIDLEDVKDGDSRGVDGSVTSHEPNQTVNQAQESKEEEGHQTNSLPMLNIPLRTRFSFHGEAGSDELDVTAGVRLVGITKNDEWWVAADENERIGMIPVSYCQILS